MPAISSVSGTVERGGEVIDRDLLHVEQAIQQLTNVLTSPEFALAAVCVIRGLK